MVTNNTYTEIFRILYEFDWSESAVRADMTVGQEFKDGIFGEYYNLESDIVKNQKKAYGGK